jgi:ATPase subunit of ABC transporter with duplicated ATPase domains
MVMTVLEAHGVCVAFAASAPVFEEASFVLTPGFYGLVGANGGGKTSLLRVLAGELTPHEGRLLVRPANATIAYAAQTPETAGANVRALAETRGGLGGELLGRLGLDPSALDDPARWSTLSPGERQRWHVAAALAAEPDILLLDEPTNHLDGEARARLVATLARHRGIAVLVSHDRDLLERLPRAILRVHQGKVTLYAGRYSAARGTWDAERRERESEHAHARAAVRAIEQRLETARRNAEGAARGTGARALMKDKNDHDGRGSLAKGAARAAASRAGRSAGVVRNELSRAEARVPTVERDRTAGSALFAAYVRAPSPTLFHLDAPELRAGPRVVLRDVRLTIGRDDRIRLGGRNGAGKTTLLRALLASRAGRGEAGRVLYLPQEIEPAETARRLDDLRALGDDERGRVFSVFGALGSDPGRLLRRGSPRSGALSPGEARKLAIATGLGRHAWALVLDEPTNHLDLPTIERLESALEGYPGAIVLVTHDDAFAAAVVRRTIAVEEAYGV